MTCNVCEVEMAERVATLEHPYRYTTSGLENVWLAGIRVYVCPRCKTESPLIPRFAELHRMIARHIAQKPALLAGDEIRFLRKNAGLSAQKFAALLGINPAHLSRVENGKTGALGAPTDRLARFLALSASDGEEARAQLLEVADALAHRQGRAKTLRFKLDRNRWRMAA